jgi:hypothetical protein
MYLDPAAREFFVDYDRMATDAAAMLRLEAGRNSHDKALNTLVAELSTQSELFRRLCIDTHIEHRIFAPHRPTYPLGGGAQII